MRLHKRGQGLVEFALILPILLLVFMSIIDAALLIQGYLATNHAAREATRWAVAYQPVQGGCYDYNGDGNEFNDGWPWCTGDPYETEATYNARRVEMIKLIARDAAVGLRMDPICLDTGCIGNHIDDPGMFGVQVWGFPSFEDPEQEDHPGLPGLPVRVRVVHNVPLFTLTPFLPEAKVRVTGMTEMVNEGIQVGYGNEPPPGFAPPPPPGPPGGGPGGGGGGGGGDPTALELNFETAENQLPVDVSHPVIATVRDADGNLVQGAQVIFTTDAGSFNPSQTVQQISLNTLANGQAALQIYSNIPATANIQAWVDLDGDQQVDSGEPSDTAVKTWVGGNYEITLNFETATNTLPDEREHMVEAHVKTPGGSNVAGAPVTFGTDAGSFRYAGTGTTIDVVNTDADGKARTAIYANQPITAHIDAWLDYNQNQTVDTVEPVDSAIKYWVAPGPYLVVTNHNPEPLEVISVDVMDHLSSGNPHSLWWCPVSITATNIISSIAYPIDVDPGTQDFTGVTYEVPSTASGTYRIESHTGTGGSNGCAETGTLVAYSADIRIRAVRPDLVITDLQVLNELDDLLTGYPITLTLDVENTTPSNITEGPFDLDIYLNLDEAPLPKRFGVTKQWVDNLGPFESTVITAVIQSYAFGPNTIWAQVDTTDYVDEGEMGGEDNNTFGPVEVVLECGEPDPNMSDTFDGGVHAPWVIEEVGGGVNGSHTSSGDQLEIDSYGTTIWGGNNNFYYLYQGYDGDFDARLRIIQKPSSSNWAKVGLHVRESTASNAPYVMNMITNDRNPGGTQSAYRGAPGDSGSRATSDQTVGLPIWSRIVRQDNTYYYYYSEVAEPERSDWVEYGSHTASRELPLIGIANASYSNSNMGHAIVDDFRICTAGSGAGGKPEVNPPGMIECEQLIRVPGFEGNASTVFEYWDVGRAGSYERGSTQFYRGSFSMRLHASLGSVPCDAPASYLEPYVYQEVQLPTEVYSFSTLTVDGHYLSSGSNLECSFPDQPDTDDEFQFLIKTVGDTAIYTGTLMNGGVPPKVWNTVRITPTDALDLTSYGGDRLRFLWGGTHDGDFDGTFFYLDEVGAEVCTVWPIPDHEPGTATFGGLVTTLGEYSVPIILPGADVWAYARDGQLHHTRSIHDGTYHFYNIPPGDYIVYAEAWIGGQPRYATTNVSLIADQEDHNINLFLQ